MTRLNKTFRGNVEPEIERWNRQIATQLNNVSEGRLAGYYNASTAAPTTGTWAKGDFVMNSNPSELGTAGSKYVIDGWKCLTSGTPGTWVQKRFLTGN